MFKDIEFYNLPEEVLDYSVEVIKAIEIIMKNHQLCGEKITFDMAAKIVGIACLEYRLNSIGDDVYKIKNCLNY